MVWFHPDEIANILSFDNVQKKHKVIYNKLCSTQGRQYQLCI